MDLWCCHFKKVECHWQKKKIYQFLCKNGKPMSKCHITNAIARERWDQITVVYNLHHLMAITLKKNRQRLGCLSLLQTSTDILSWHHSKEIGISCAGLFYQLADCPPKIFIFLSRGTPTCCVLLSSKSMYSWWERNCSIGG